MPLVCEQLPRKHLVKYPYSMAAHHVIYMCVCVCVCELKIGYSLNSSHVFSHSILQNAE